MTDDVIIVEGLVKQYEEKRAVDGLDLRVPRGTVQGLLGPNGAGKTTLVRVLSTLAAIDGGRAEIDGFDVATEAEAVRYRIGLAGQHASVDEVLSGRANLVMFGRLFHLTPCQARARADALLEQFRLTDAADRPVRTYSGGMRRRLDLAASLLIAPPVLFLDEPTTGLDPRARAEIWESVRALVDDGTTVLLTTQYLDEADQLADHIAVIDGGRIIAEGSPDVLKQTIGSHVEVVLSDAALLGQGTEIVGRVTGSTPTIERDDRRILAATDGGSLALIDVVRELDRCAIGIEDVAMRRPTLDEVFLQLTDEEKVTA
ncbi:ATP-binding cassette domain-containing protein [Aquihabitans sp. McL0605]|uniref:ATP-binding cassette domain-containing protein n=1 Tax=Aquihabitans sp. McL0605 TaxID=3415671 RepID=UPI003CEF32B5